MQQGQLQEALNAAQQACRKYPNDPDAWLTQAAVHAQRFDYGNIIDCCQRVLKLKPRHAVAAFNLGLASQSLGRLEAARDAYQRALEVDPGYAAARINLAAVFCSLGQPDSGLEAAKAALEAAPDQAAAHLALARAYLLADSPQQAIDCLQSAQDRFGNTHEINCQIAICHKGLGHTDKARELLQEITRTHPGFAQGWAELGHIERQAEHYADAATYYERAVRLQPNFELRFNLAYCLYAAERFGPAHKLYEQLLEQDADNPLLHNNLGRLYERLGQIEPAEQHFRRAVELQPRLATAHCNLGRVLLAKKDLAEARRSYQQAIENDAEYYEGHYGLGQTLCELAEPQAAIQAFRDALKCKPDLSEATYYIASLEGRIGADDDHCDYVAGLFDQYAEKFDQELVDRLQYKTPEYLHEALQEQLLQSPAKLNILDLGCGTGLCAPLFKPAAKRLVGMDLSSKMIDKARERGLYDELAVADLLQYLEECDKHYDLILAADVFVYLGNLEPVFVAARQALQQTGIFAFSTETCPGDGYRIQGSGRHAHSKNYIINLAASTGFELLEMTDRELRLEYGKPVAGTVYILKKII
ncbi:methyltransferase [Thiohalobacter thiocyanaticus]|uniref:Methyltransferase n=1 Tax=Thiohalobacter thiocyanaticus TaxID=585455 RepID=A0A1Z4VPN6_9GAMM|nr:methyltransferase [Thiohalobacter thiocyanaticus]